MGVLFDFNYVGIWPLSLTGVLIFTLQFNFLFVPKIGFSFTFISIFYIVLNILFYKWKDALT